MKAPALTLNGCAYCVLYSVNIQYMNKANNSPWCHIQEMHQLHYYIAFATVGHET